MTRLLNSDLARLRINMIFRIVLIFSAFMGFFCPVFGHRWLVVTEAPVSSYSLDYYFLKFINVIAFAAAAVCSFFVGTEYSDGTFRNKIVVGHSRSAIYLSVFLTNAMAACIICTMYMILALCVGVPLLGAFQHFERKEIMALVLCVYAVMIAFAAIITLISMLTSNRVASLGICICVVLAALCLGLHQLNLLTEVVFWQDVMKTRREMTLFLVDFLPGSQMMEFFALRDDLGNLNPYVMLGGSAVFTVASTVCGVLLFRKKDLK